MVLPIFALPAGTLSLARPQFQQPPSNSVWKARNWLRSASAPATPAPATSVAASVHESATVRRPAESPSPRNVAPTRRFFLLLSSLGVPAYKAAAEGTLETEDGAAGASEAPLSPSASRGEIYSTKYYSYYVPRGWEPQSMGSPDKMVPSIESRFLSPDGTLSVSVTATDSSTIKPTFLQLQDVSEWGDPDEVFRLTVRGARLLSSSSRVVEGVEKDTGTLRGVVKQPDQTLYFYEAISSKGQRLFLTVAGKGGKIFKAKCAVPDELLQSSPETADILRKVAQSFRLN